MTHYEDYTECLIGDIIICKNNFFSERELDKGNYYRVIELLGPIHIKVNESHSRTRGISRFIFVSRSDGSAPKIQPRVYIGLTNTEDLLI